MSNRMKDILFAWFIWNLVVLFVAIPVSIALGF
jgi:hypothetical protein